MSVSGMHVEALFPDGTPLPSGVFMGSFRPLHDGVPAGHLFGELAPFPYVVDVRDVLPFGLVRNLKAHAVWVVPVYAHPAETETETETEVQP